MLTSANPEGTLIGRANLKNAWMRVNVATLHACCAYAGRHGERAHGRKASIYCRLVVCLEGLLV